MKDNILAQMKICLAALLTVCTVVMFFSGPPGVLALCYIFMPWVKSTYNYELAYDPQYFAVTDTFQNVLTASLAVGVALLLARIGSTHPRFRWWAHFAVLMTAVVTMVLMLWSIGQGAIKTGSF